eukprot:jgi/Mesen1/2912/ME000175S02067
MAVARGRAAKSKRPRNERLRVGLIQTVYELSDGSGMILTVGKYVTPAHSDIDGNGIEPDFRRNPGPSAAERKLASCTVPVADSALRTSPLS